MHYGDERGSNSPGGVKALVILGLPIPNVKAFKEEAEGFLYDVGELDCTWVFWKFYLPIVGGQSVHVNVDGYWEGFVGGRYQQKCQSSLFQALHRIRPYLVPAEEDRYVFMFTNMPVEGVLLEESMRDP